MATRQTGREQGRRRRDGRWRRRDSAARRFIECLAAVFSCYSLAGWHAIQLGGASEEFRDEIVRRARRARRYAKAMEWFRRRREPDRDEWHRRLFTQGGSG